MELFLYCFIGFFICAMFFFASFAVYFVPVIIAYIRKHDNITAIALLNIFAGWTFFGWLAALLWALNSDVRNFKTQAESECNSPEHSDN